MLRTHMSPSNIIGVGSKRQRNRSSDAADGGHKHESTVEHGELSKLAVATLFPRMQGALYREINTGLYQYIFA